MKRSIIFVLTILLSMLSLQNVNAVCNDESIKIVADNIDISFNGVTGINDTIEDKVALYIQDIPDDMFVVVTNNTTNERKTYRNIENGYILQYTPSPVNIYGYTIRIYSSAPECENELIRKENVTSLIYNPWSQSTECSELNEQLLSSEWSEEEIEVLDVCEEFASKEYTESEFTKAYNDYINRENEPELSVRILTLFYKYYYFALIPMVIISVYYAIRVRVIRKSKKVHYEEE